MDPPSSRQGSELESLLSPIAPASPTAISQAAEFDGKTGSSQDRHGFLNLSGDMAASPHVAPSYPTSAMLPWLIRYRLSSTLMHDEIQDYHRGLVRKDSYLLQSPHSRLRPGLLFVLLSADSRSIFMAEDINCCYFDTKINNGTLLLGSI